MHSKGFVCLITEALAVVLEGRSVVYTSHALLQAWSAQEKKKSCDLLKASSLNLNRQLPGLQLILS